jgi:hypothetical protein
MKEIRMFLRKRLKDPNLVLSIGCVALCLANVASYALHRWGAFPESMVDGLTGFFFGVAIGTMLLSIYRRTHAMSDDSGCMS